MIKTKFQTSHGCLGTESCYDSYGNLSLELEKKYFVSEPGLPESIEQARGMKPFMLGSWRILRTERHKSSKFPGYASLQGGQAIVSPSEQESLLPTNDLCRYILINILRLSNAHPTVEKVDSTNFYQFQQ